MRAVQYIQCVVPRRDCLYLNNGSTTGIYHALMNALTEQGITPHQSPQPASEDSD